MGVVNHYKGFDSNFISIPIKGKLRDLNLPWEHTKIFKGDQELDPDYEVQENDVLIIQEYHGTGIEIVAIVLGVISIGVAIGTGIYAAEQAKKAQREMEDRLKRIGKDNKQGDVSSIPQMGDAKNERAEGKSTPIILGHHIFAPYFLSEPYMKPEGDDGVDLYWYGSFICGQDGLCFDKIRNGSIELLNLSGNTAQTGDFNFDRPNNYNPDAEDFTPPPFYDPLNFIEIAQSGIGFGKRPDSYRFEEKWVDSIESSVEIGRKKKDSAPIVDDLFIEDLGADPIIRETARFPYKAEVEIFVDGLHGWDSQNGEATPASVGIELEWSTDQNFPANKTRVIDLGFPKDNVYSNNLSFPSSTRAVDLVAKYISSNPTSTNPILTYNLMVLGGATFGDLTVSSVTLRKTYSQNAAITSTVSIVTSDGTKNFSGTAKLGKDLIIPQQSFSTNLLTRNKVQQMRFIGTVNFYNYPSEIFNEAGDPVFIRATRTTRMYSGGYRDRVYLSAIRTQQYNPNTSSLSELIAAKNINERLVNKFCRMGIKIKVNENTQEFLDRFNIIASMTGRTWDGTKWKQQWDEVENEWVPAKEKTSNSAAVLLELISGLVHDLSRHKDSEIDLKSFGELYEFCNSQKVKIKGITDPVNVNLECNGVLTSGTKKADVIRSILATCDGGLYINEFGKLMVYADKKQTVPKALLNPQRIISMTEQRSLERKADGYSVEFIDEETNWNQATHRILRPSRIDWVDQHPGEDFYSPIKLDFTTSYNQAMWHARRMMAKEIHRPGEVKAQVGKEGRFYTPGSLLKVQDENFKIGIGSGEITELIVSGDQVLGLKLMERFDIASDRDYYIDYYVVDEGRNKVVNKQIQSVGEYTDRLMFTFPIDLNSPDVPVFENILSVLHGEPGVVKIYESKRYLVSDLSENEDGYDLSLVQYNDVIYDTTSIDEIPEYRSDILSSPPKVYDAVGRKPIDGEPGQGLLNAQAVEVVVPPMIENIVTENVTNIVSEVTPRYRGKTNFLDNTGIIGLDVMNLGDRILYTGNQEGLVTNRVYRWLGGSWELLNPPTATNRENAWYYLEANGDVTEGAPSEVFSFAQIASLVSSAIFAQFVGAVDIELIEKVINGVTKYGSIRSGNYLEGQRGFKINYNGDTEFNNGIFRGILAATQINITGTVNSGTAYLLRGDSKPASVMAESGWLSAGYEGLLKEIRTVAGGSCLLRMYFPRINPARIGDINYGNIRIEVNGNNLSGYEWYHIGSNNWDMNIDIPNIQLGSGLNTIRLYGTPDTGGNAAPNFGVFNTTFELRCAQNPLFLGLLG